MDLEWMAWTVPTAIFFTAIGLCLGGMTAWQIVSPSFPRRGFLPIETTRGDRFFIALLTAAFIMVGWIAATETTLWLALALSAAVGVLIMRYG
jgi:predicted small integral membrane protein